MPKGKSSEGGGAPVSFAAPADRSSRSRLLDHHLCETCTSTQREPVHYLYLYLYLRGDEQHHGEPNHGAGGISTSPLYNIPLAMAGPTKAPEVPAGDETKGSMIALAAKATSYKELNLGT